MNFRNRLRRLEDAFGDGPDARLRALTSDSMVIKLLLGGHVAGAEDSRHRNADGSTMTVADWKARVLTELKGRPVESLDLVVP
jgi:hypothetical protein